MPWRPNQADPKIQAVYRAYEASKPLMGETDEQHFTRIAALHGYSTAFEPQKNGSRMAYCEIPMDDVSKRGVEAMERHERYCGQVGLSIDEALAIKRYKVGNTSLWPLFLAAHYYSLDKNAGELMCQYAEPKYDPIRLQLEEFAKPPFEKMIVGFETPIPLGLVQARLLCDKDQTSLLIYDNAHDRMAVVPFQTREAAYREDRALGQDTYRPNWSMRDSLCLILARRQHRIAGHTPKMEVSRNGKPVTFFSRTEIVIDLAARDGVHKAISGLDTERASPRAHEVAGHFRHYHRRAECEHEWLKQPAREPADGKERWSCTGCEGVRTWTPEFQRGDASRGFVRQVRKVKG